MAKPLAGPPSMNRQLAAWAAKRADGDGIAVRFSGAEPPSRVSGELS